MSDKREAILARLVEVLRGVTNLVTVERNRDVVDRAKRPAAYVYDGDEAAEVEQISARGPAMVSMTPEIYLLIGGDAADIGARLNALRAAVLKAILTDATLASLVGANGKITYSGCATGLSRGRSMEGEMGLNLAFTYPFQPTTL